MNSHLLVFHSEKNFLQALDFLKKNHPMEIEAYSAFDLKERAEFSGQNYALNPVKIAVFAGAMFGVATSAFIIWYSATIDAPLNIGGRPLNSWPADVPIIWVMAVLFGGVFGFASFLWKLSLPKPYDPIFSFKNFELQKNQFYIYVSSFINPNLLNSLKADSVERGET